MENIKDVSSSIIDKVGANLEKGKYLNLQTYKQTNIENASLEDILKLAKSQDLEPIARNKVIKSLEIES